MDSKKDFNIDFIGLGAPKAGTTWIYKCLSEHPEVCTTEFKETDYLIHLIQGKKSNLSSYEDYFAHCNAGKIKGEFSVNYFSHSQVPAEIKRRYPNAKLIVSLRDPLERIISQYLFSSKQHHKTMSLSEAVKKDPEYYLEPSLYAKHLKRYYEHFPKEQILVLIYEEIEKDPEAFMRRIYQFLEIDDSVVVPNTFKRTNIGAQKLVYSFKLDRLLTRFRNVIIKSKSLSWLHWLGKTLNLNRFVYKIFLLNTVPDNLRKPVDKSLVSEHQKNEIAPLLNNDVRMLIDDYNLPVQGWSNALLAVRDSGSDRIN